MDDARQDIGRRIVEAARMAAWLHLQQEAGGQSRAAQPSPQSKIQNQKSKILRGVSK
jgi:hypothetical protein